MKTETHTVTIPISDYNELLKASESIGITKLGKDTPLYHAIDEAYRSTNMRFGGKDDGVPKNIELYFKTI